MRPSSTLCSALAVSLLLSVAACGGKGKPAPDGRMVPGYSKDSGKLTELKYDRNNDGRMDTWATMDGLRVVRIQIDENGDGKPDRFEYYRPAPGAGAKPLLERVEISTRRDGQISRREFLEEGRVVRIEEDTDGDGQVDKWETYRDGALVQVDLDTAHRGKADRRLVYGPGGSLERIEADGDGTGNFQPIAQGR